MKKKLMKMTEDNQKDIFNQSWSNYLMIGLIIIVISTLFFKIGFLNYSPKAHDTFQWRYSSQQLIEYNQNNSDRALWTDNMFSGMPSYLLSFPARFPFLHNIFSGFNKIISWRVSYLIFGAIGMYILLIYLKFTPLIALFSALSFALSCHFIGILEIGHNTKFKAIMYLPWIFLAFDDLRQNKRVLSLGLLCIFLIDQLRINHFQISYYTYLMLFIYWLVYLVKSIKDKSLKDFYVFSGLVILALVVSSMAVANPYLSTYEYSQHTIRGGSTGLSTDYATSWSFGILEPLTFLVPNFYGGISPYYWGPMPFTQTYMYMGILVFYLALMAGIFYFKKTKIKALVIICVITLLISFGKHLPFLSNMLLSYLPLFNKFRVPAMILSITQFCFPVLAAYGIKLFIEKSNKPDPLFNKVVLISLLSSVCLFLLFAFGEFFFSGLAFSKPEEFQRYQPAQLEQLRLIRMDMLLKSGMQSFGFLLGGILLLLLLVKSYLKINVVLVLLVALTVFDVSLINKAHFKDEILVKESSIMHEFPVQLSDTFLLEDIDLFRIYPFHDFGNARWSYFHQTIGGYHGAKINRYQEMIEKNLYAELLAGIPINWNIINMLNVKYLIFNSRVNIPYEGIEYAFFDRDTQNFIYKNNFVLPRAWFVKNSEIIKDRNRLSLRLNDPSFDPAETVLLENEIPDFSFSEESFLELNKRTIHYTKWTSQNPVPSFMVISEIYYPEGWNVYINNQKADVIPANYILRGVHIPEGNNKIEMKFEPKSYSISIILSAIGLALSLIFCLFGLFSYYNNNYGSGVVFKLKS